MDGVAQHTGGRKENVCFKWGSTFFMVTAQRGATEGGGGGDVGGWGTGGQYRIVYIGGVRHARQCRLRSVSAKEPSEL